MKGFLEKYRNISVWLSLFILAMWFVGASDQENRMPCMLLAFLAGAQPNIRPTAAENPTPRVTAETDMTKSVPSRFAAA